VKLCENLCVLRGKKISTTEGTKKTQRTTKINTFKKMNYQVNEKGYYGEFGGSWIPEMMYTNIDELKTRYLEIIESEAFKNEFDDLMKNYVGRPSPLYFAKRLSEHYGSKIYLKREDLNHTGSHKLNNTIGQICWQKN
jgi:tryptophan synthase beta chain